METAIDDAATFGHARSPLSPALTLILVTLFMPVEFSFFIFGLRLTVTRLLFLILTPTLFAKLGMKIASGNYRFVVSDVFAFAAALWMLIGTAEASGMADALAHSGPVALEFLCAYMAPRVLLVGHGDAVRFTDLLCIMISLVALDATLDTVTGRYFTHEISASITGLRYMGYNPDEYRYGLLRAAGTIEHPILFGFICSVGLMLATAVKVRWRTFCIILCSLGVIISISSAPQQSALMGLGLLIYSRVFAWLRRRWLLLSIPPVILAIALFLATPTPFGHLFDLLTINSQTAYYRLYIWNSVGPAILDNPLFAVSDTDYDYHGSIDSLWLVLALEYGMPCAIFVALSMIGCCSRRIEWPARLSEEERKLGTVLGIIMFLMIFMSFTVDFWGPTWIMVGLLVGLRANLGECASLNTEPPVVVSELVA